MLLERQFCLLSLLSVSKLVKAKGVGHLSACLPFKICYDLIDLVFPIICSFKLQHSNSKVSMSSCSIMHHMLLLLVPYFGCEEHSGIFLANAVVSNLHSKSAACNTSKDIATNQLWILVCSNVYCIDQRMLLWQLQRAMAQHPGANSWRILLCHNKCTLHVVQATHCQSVDFKV